MIWWVLTGIFALFVIFAALRGHLHKRFGFKICALCAAVSMTWIILIALKLAGMEISNLLIGILMGESITGIVLLFEDKAKQKRKEGMLWLKVAIALLGTLLVYMLLTEGFSLSFIIILTISAILAVGIYIGIYGKSGKKEKGKIMNKIGKDEHSRFRKEIKKLEEKLEHCCD